MVSFGVESLFTNTPLDECINLAVKYITEGNPGLKLRKNELKRLFEFSTKETHLLFNDTFYNHVGGVAMGSPLAPVLANLFMGHHENIWNNTGFRDIILSSLRRRHILPFLLRTGCNPFLPFHQQSTP